MRKLFPVLLAASMLLAASAASAGAMLGGSFTIRLAGLPPLEQLANLTGGSSFDGATVTLANQEFGPSDIDLPDSLFTGVPQISDLRITGLDLPGNGTQTFAPGAAGTILVGPAPSGSTTGAGLGGTAAMSGDTTICVYACAAIQVKVPLNINGVGGQLFATALFQPLTVTAGQGWSSGAAVVTGVNSQVNVTLGNGTCVPVTCSVDQLATGEGNGQYVTKVTFNGTNNLTAGGGGSVTLVTPIRTKSLAGNLPLFGIVTLLFEGDGSVPEPGTLLLLGSGVIGLIAMGRRKRA